MNTENTQDIFDMDDSAFIEQYGSGDSLVQDFEEVDSNEESTSNFESDEPLDETVDEEDTDEVDGDSEGIEEVSDSIDTDDDSIASTEESSTTDASSESKFNYEDEFKKLIGNPIKGAGKEITLASADEAIKLIQMGMGYHKSMEQLKPTKKLISMLENNDMLDESKLSYAIDLINKNPQAINRLIAESGIDTDDLDEDESENYKPTDYSVSEEKMAIDSALKEISDSPSYAKTVNVIARQWDDASKEIIKKHPETIGIINSHIESGLFDTVSNEVERQRMLGMLPMGMSAIEVYKKVGDMLYAQAQNQTVPNNGQQDDFEQANVKAPIKKPSREAVVKRKKATNVSGTNGNSQRQVSSQDVFEMDDAEFLKRFGSGNFY